MYRVLAAHVDKKYTSSSIGYVTKAMACDLSRY